jgi:hypothetical protein
MSNRRVESFLLRLVVQESDAQDTEAWRGRIQHVSSGCERQFEHLQELIEFIGEQMVNEQSIQISSIQISCREQLSAE